MVWRNWHASHGPSRWKQELAGLFSGGVRLHLNAIGLMLMGSPVSSSLNAKLGRRPPTIPDGQQLVTILLVLASGYDTNALRAAWRGWRAGRLALR